MIEALYIDIPFCKSKCSYCNFESMSCSNEAVLDAYVLALNKQMRRASKAGLLANIKTIYIGGGTPTHLGLARLNEIVSMLNFCLHMGEVEEFSIECNPESLTFPMVRDLFSQGIMRFSVGAQSFDDEVLKGFNRAHNVSDIYPCVEHIRRRTDNFSLDLICGAQGQTLRSWDTTLKAALKLQPAHISIYPLSIDDGCALSKQVERGEYMPANQDLMATFMQHAQGLIHAAGLSRYEVASYAAKGRECKHNIAYWTGVHYLGLGAAASSMLSAKDYKTCLEAGVFAENVFDDSVGCGVGCNASVFSESTLDGSAGCGAGACSEILPASTFRVRVSQAESANAQYFIEHNGKQLVNAEFYDEREALLEDAMLSFRTTRGLGQSLYKNVRAVEPKIDDVLEKLQHQGLVTAKTPAGKAEVARKIEPADKEVAAGNASKTCEVGAVGNASKTEPTEKAGQKHYITTERGWLLGNEVFGAICELI